MRRAVFCFGVVLAVGCGGGGSGPNTLLPMDDAGTTPRTGADGSATTPPGFGDDGASPPQPVPGADGSSPAPDADGGVNPGPMPTADGGGGPMGDSGVPPPVPVPATDRTKVQLRDGWKFMGSNTLTGAEVVTYNDSAWPTVSVPHTWDSVTATTNGLNTYSNAWYRTQFSLTAADLMKRVYVYFEGVSQVADVYVNGKHVGLQHRGGYTHFIVDATSAATMGTNVLAVQASNATCADCLPDGTTTGNGRLFKTYGGIYRKAWLITTNAYHVATTDFASSGVYVTPANVSGASATVNTKVLVTNDGPADKVFSVKEVVSDPAGNPVLTTMADVTVKTGTTAAAALTGMVMSPKLWGPGTPNLYNVVVSVTVGGVLTDAVGEHIGFRSYQLSATDFILNGVSTRLRGLAKHQETEYHASAVTDDELVADWDAIQEMGANYMRLVHYPHAQLEYDLADQRGIMVWAENGHTNGGAGTMNGDDISREMVYQNWNHPSIIFWSAGNEAGGVAATSEYAAVMKMADPSRPIVYASSGQNPTNVDFTFHNTYAGWYTATMYAWLTAGDHWVSETGAGQVITCHTSDAFPMTFSRDMNEPEEYGALVNEVRFDDLFRNPTHVPAFSGWQFRDISDVKYHGLLNSKGLVTFGGFKKDIFYHFKALAQKSTVVHLVGRHYFLRGANGAGQGAVKAYSNAATLTLTVNGTSVGAQANDLYKHPNGTPIKDVFYWPNALVMGKNVVSVTDGAGATDTMIVYYRGSGMTVPPDTGAKVTNLTATPGPAYFIDTPITAQHPFYIDFDGTGDNTFDAIPAAATGASFIATRRQGDATKRTDLAFDLPNGGEVFVMFTKGAGAPAWVTGGGFVDTGATGVWRDNGPKLVSYGLYKKTFAAGSHVTLATTAIDYVVLVK
ncbi:MAG: hypothetical protein M3O46_03360 [Myxococcota bacterium]|nr:hypothetical protein [Myxococcota bacterium]